MVLYQPPKGHVDNEKTPNYPQVDYRKRPLPTGVFFLCVYGLNDVCAGDVKFRCGLDVTSRCKFQNSQNDRSPRHALDPRNHRREIFLARYFCEAWWTRLSRNSLSGKSTECASSRDAPLPMGQWFRFSNRPNYNGAFRRT